MPTSHFARGSWIEFQRAVYKKDDGYVKEATLGYILDKKKRCLLVQVPALKATCTVYPESTQIIHMDDVELAEEDVSAMIDLFLDLKWFDSLEALVRERATIKS